MSKISLTTYQSPCGELLLGAFEERICLCDWKYRKMRQSIDRRIKAALRSEYTEEECPVLDELGRQLDQYFSKQRTKFELPYLMVGTDFQKAVWRALLEIGYGETETYAGLAARVKSAAVRAVGTANGANALSILVPCHRIVAGDGSLGGYAGGLTAKRKLIELERQKQLDWAGY